MKKILISLLLLSELNSIGQSITFYGYRLDQYKCTVQKVSGEYAPYFENAGEWNNFGALVLNTTAKTISVTWQDGDEPWVMRYATVQTKFDNETGLGNVKRTYYTGNWLDDNGDCMLVVTETSTACIFQVYSAKIVVTNAVRIDTWKKIITFFTSGGCIN